MKTLSTALFIFAAAAIPVAAAPADYPVAPGPFQPTMESLLQYKCPDWFRDAKFGIWAHWGPQAVPEFGDWYAKRMYQEGDAKYKHHLENYGHPSEHGYKDIIPLWKAEKWDPVRLIDLYKKAGAKYFVSMGSHHDNFYLWNSKLHKWNSVQMGPKRDVVGEWQKAAKAAGLKFGVSEHLGASFTWFQPSHGADKSGPKAGVPYDGANPAFQDLYHFPAEPGDTGWYSNNPRWHRQWYERIRELVDNYQPDLLYTDGGVPFGNEAGLSMIAHLYNASAARNGGVADTVYNCKQVSDGRWAQDLERGVMPDINPYPWQTDTSIGDWYYNKNWKFRPVSWTIHMLVDIVSKNGNLLLNIVQRPDGSLDPEVETQLGQLADWIAIHGEAIYASRPWEVHGEGPVRTKGGNFKEEFAYSARDIRFTTRGGHLYAIALGWPEDGRLRIRSLAKAAGKIEDIRLLGSDAGIKWTQADDALVVNLPATRVSEFTAALRITGAGLKPVPIPETAVVIFPDAKGNIVLSSEDATLHGELIKTETKGVHSNIGFWDNADEWASWVVKFPAPGEYKLTARVATQHAGIRLEAELAGEKLAAAAPKTGDWENFTTMSFGTLKVSAAGEQKFILRPADPAIWKAVNVRDVRLVK